MVSIEAFLSIIATEEGIEIYFNDIHCLKAYLPIKFNDEFSSMQISEQMAMQISEQTSLVLKLKQKISKLQNENEELNQKNEIEVILLEYENKQLTSHLA